MAVKELLVPDTYLPRTYYGTMKCDYITVRFAATHLNVGVLDAHPLPHFLVEAFQLGVEILLEVALQECPQEGPFQWRDLGNAADHFHIRYVHMGADTWQRLRPCEYRILSDDDDE